LVAAAIHGAKSCYQVTSGELELKGGGFKAENKLLSSLGKESLAIEKLVNRLIAKFDLVIVRGSNAKNYIKSSGYLNKLEVVTGSVLTDEKYMSVDRPVDVIFVGRLAEYKRPEVFIETIRRVVEKKPDLVVQIAGDGPLRSELDSIVNKYALEKNIDFLGKVSNVPELLGKSKVLVLTSRWEGVSIAMLEAMALGVVPVVRNVGDLSDYVQNYKTGFIVNSYDPNEFAQNILTILEDDRLREELSSNSRKAVISTSDRTLLSERWKSIIQETVQQ
jgi:glycosyltransferase involved in cell wall biosynthesis